MTVSAEFAPVLARMAAKQLGECLPFLSPDVKREIMVLLVAHTALATSKVLEQRGVALNSRRDVVQDKCCGCSGVASPSSLASADDPAPH